MADGFKVADAYVELTLDKDKLRRELEAELTDLPRQAAPAADRGGRDLGDKIGRGMSDAITRSAPAVSKAVGDTAARAGANLQAAVETWSGRVAKARRAEVEAAGAVELAEKRLTEARANGLTEGSARQLAMTQSLEKAQYRLAEATATVTRSTTEHAAAQQKLAEFMATAAEAAGPEAERSGRGLGDKLSQGMSMAIVRNSPLIVAAIGAILAVGAPLMATASVALFAGIGIAAAAQSQEVRRAWLGTWAAVRDGAISDARAIEPVLVQMAGRVGQAFEGMRPLLQSAFSAAAPQIAVFTDGILALANNALPGMVRAVEEGLPVTQGFADFLAKVGTGLGEFFDRIMDHGPAAGAVWSSLGDSFAELLPLLGELLGQGAELAANVLPLLSGSLGAVLTVVEALGPLLPLVAAGFLAWKAVDVLAPMVDRLAIGLSNAATNGGAFAGVAGRASGAVSGLSAAVGPLAVGIGVWAAIFAQSQSQIRNWTAALNEGGDAARQAKEDMAGFDDNMGRVGTVLDTSAAKLNIFTASTSWAFSLLKDDTDEAREAHEKFLAGLIPTEVAARNVAIAERELATAIGDHGANSPQAQAAQERLTDAERIARDVADDHARAINGVTEAMVAQADQARAQVDATFAYERSIDSVEDAQVRLAEAQAHLNDENEATRTSMEDVSDAARDLNESYSAQVAAAEQLATSKLPAAMDENQKKIIGAKAALDELNGLIAFGVQLPPSMEEYRQQLMRITGEADGAKLAQAQMAAAVGELGFAVEALPDGKAIKITGLEPDMIGPIRDQLRGLGFDVVTLPDGKSVEVRALTDEAKNNVDSISAMLTALGIKVAEPQVVVNPQPVIDGAAAAGGAVDALGQKSANPLADLHDDPLVMKALADQGLLTNLGAFGATPWADLYDDPLQVAAWEDQGLLSDLNVTNALPTADLADQALLDKAANDLAHLNILDGSRPTPLADIQDDPLIGTYLNDLGLLNNLAGQTPTPVGFLDDGPFQGTTNSVLARLGDVAAQRPTPIIDAWDWASPVINAVKGGIAGIVDKTVVITSINRAVNQVVNGFGQIIGATGGQVGTLGPPPIRRALGGPVRGPGTTTSDDVGPFSVAGGGQAWLSNFEWIIKAASALGYGNRRMAAVNNGTARILLPGEQLEQPIRRQVGGPLARFGDRLDHMSDRLGQAEAVTDVADAGVNIHIDNLIVKIETPLNVMNERDVDRAVQVIERKLLDLGRRRN